MSAITWDNVEQQDFYKKPKTWGAYRIKQIKIFSQANPL